jgi:predicted GIY-YIG superfamily endonuclease
MPAIAVYALRFESGETYLGITSDLPRRLREYRPVTLLFLAKQLKSLRFSCEDPPHFLAFVRSFGPQET